MTLELSSTSSLPAFTYRDFGKVATNDLQFMISLLMCSLWRGNVWKAWWIMFLQKLKKQEREGVRS